MKYKNDKRNNNDVGFTVFFLSLSSTPNKVLFSFHFIVVVIAFFQLSFDFWLLTSFSWLSLFLHAYGKIPFHFSQFSIFLSFSFCCFPLLCNLFATTWKWQPTKGKAKSICFHSIKLFYHQKEKKTQKTRN